MLDEIERIARLWPASGKAIALTGAGISVASGIPDFRSPGGLWSRYAPMRVATVDALENDPSGVWEFLLDAVEVMSRAKPNPAHLALAQLEQAGLLEAVVTQNIDGLHQRAGSSNVVEFHGSMDRWRCNACGRPHEASAGPGGAPVVTASSIPWLCSCGGVVRPDIVFFGEAIPLDALSKSGQLACGAHLTLVVGTSLEVAPANSLPGLTRQHGGKVVEINLESELAARPCDARIAARAEEALPILAGLLLQNTNLIRR
jgi:NAD-dependent deacetylase